MPHKAFPVLPVSDLRTQAKEILETVKAQPVIITQRGRANAVLLSFDLYNEMTARLEHLEDLRDAALLRRAQETSEGVVPASALLTQYERQFREPLQTDVKSPSAQAPLTYAVAKETRGAYRPKRGRKKSVHPRARRRADV